MGIKGRQVRKSLSSNKVKKYYNALDNNNFNLLSLNEQRCLHHGIGQCIKFEDNKLYYTVFRSTEVAKFKEGTTDEQKNNLRNLGLFDNDFLQVENIKTIEWHYIPRY